MKNEFIKLKETEMENYIIYRSPKPPNMYIKEFQRDIERIKEDTLPSYWFPKPFKEMTKEEIYKEINEIIRKEWIEKAEEKIKLIQNMFEGDHRMYEIKETKEE